MSGNSNSSSEDVGGVVMLALLGAFLWWFFSSSMEDITEDFLEAVLKGMLEKCMTAASSAFHL